MHVVVAGGGVVGTAAALALGRAGIAVTVVERDPDPSLDGPSPAHDWDRPGCAQFVQPHVILSLATKVLRDAAPDVVERLRAAGATTVDPSPALPPGVEDPDLVSLAARRPLIEWALRSAAADLPTVDRRPGRVVGLVASGDGAGRGAPPTVTGVRLSDGSTLTADLVIDATGRGSPLPGWLDGIGAAPLRERSEECGLLYYSRFVRLRDGVTPPPRMSPVPATGDLGYAAFVTFLEDGDVLGSVLVIPSWDRDLRRLRDGAAYDATVAAVPAMRAVVGAEVAEPITPPLPMGTLRNRVRDMVVDGAPVALGVLPIGDSWFHSNPMYANGLSWGLDQAFALPQLLAEADDPGDLALAMHDRWQAELDDRYEFAAGADRSRQQLWRGEPVDVLDRSAHAGLFLQRVVGTCATQDPVLRHRLLRRNGLLDPAGALDRDEDALDEAAERFRTTEWPAPPPVPSRDELLTILDETGATPSPV